MRLFYVRYFALTEKIIKTTLLCQVNSAYLRLALAIESGNLTSLQERKPVIARSSPLPH